MLAILLLLHLAEIRLRKVDHNKFHVARESPKSDHITSPQLTIGAESMASFNSEMVRASVPFALQPAVPFHQLFSTPMWYSARIVPQKSTAAHRPAKIIDNLLLDLVRVVNQPATHRTNTAI